MKSMTASLFRLTHVRESAKTVFNSFQTQSNAISTKLWQQQQQSQEPLHKQQVIDQAINNSTYVSLLQTCIWKNSLAEGKQVQAQINVRGIMARGFLGNTLLNMYIKCESLEEARKLFDEMPERDVCSWTIMISSFSRQGSGNEALALFYGMQSAGVQPNHFTFASVLSACASMAALEEGVEIHEEVIRGGFQSDVFVTNALIDMYAKCGDMEQARQLFDEMPRPDVVSWTAMIAGYAQNGEAQEALEVFRGMRLVGMKPNLKTYASILPACADVADLERGMVIHAEIIRRGFQSHVFVESALVDMYAKCGELEISRDVFDKMPQRDIVSWTVMIAGYAQNGRDLEALEIFREMQRAGVKTGLKVFTGVLPACANLGALEEGREVHGELIRSGILSEVSVLNALIDMYAKCGSVDEARKVFNKMGFPDVFSFTAMISGYAQKGRGEEALELFQQMQQAGMKPIAKTFSCVLSAYARLGDWEQGTEIHKEIVRRGLESDVFVESALIDMYVKCGSIEKAHELFDKMLQKDIVSWTVMIAGYAQNGWGEEALKLFHQMQLAGLMPNSRTFASVLPACGDLAALEKGMEIHEQVIRSGFETDVIVLTALIDMYAKCGSLPSARNLFDKMPQRDVVSWTAMIAGYAMHGFANEALNLFEQMKHSGINPNHVTLVCVLSACCHAGLVSQGHHYFNSMSEHYHITPTMEHYGSMVDLIGRAGHLDEAQQFICKMPIKPDVYVWRCLLSACVIHKNVELGECIADHLFELSPTDAATYVLLSNIYAAVGRWSDIQKVRKMMKERGVNKDPGCSWIEVKKQLHAFITGEG